MRDLNYLIYCFIVFFTIPISCNRERHSILTDKEWKEILNPTLSLPAISENLVYSNYCNKRMDDLVAFCYENEATELGYQLSDSISNYLKTRGDKQIKQKFDTIFHIKFINDKEKFEKKHLIFSEPFLIKKGLVCFSIELIGKKDKPLNQWVFFLKKIDNKYKLILFYDYNAGKFFKLASYHNLKNVPSHN